jgi:NhaP-type Na+/H+ or K+/H+ antiporter
MRTLAVGIAVAAACVWWVMHGKDAIIEITLFAICAYASMIASEQEGGASGVLAVVSAGIFVATVGELYKLTPVGPIA